MLYWTCLAAPPLPPHPLIVADGRPVVCRPALVARVSRPEWIRDASVPRPLSRTWQASRKRPPKAQQGCAGPVLPGSALLHTGGIVRLATTPTRRSWSSQSARISAPTASISSLCDHRALPCWGNADGRPAPLTPGRLLRMCTPTTLNGGYTPPILG